MGIGIMMGLIKKKKSTGHQGTDIGAEKLRPSPTTHKHTHTHTGLWPANLSIMAEVHMNY